MKPVHALLWVLMVSIGCGGEQDPPFDELSIRDAMQAKPEAILALTTTVKIALANRLVAAIGQESPPFSLPSSTGTTWGERTIVQDGVRIKQGKDALVLIQWSSGMNDLVATSLQVPRDRAAPARPLPTVTGPLADTTAAEESRALAGKAGAILEQTMRLSSTWTLVRAPSWPAGVTATPDAIFVNPAWLTAMAGLETDSESSQTKSSQFGGRPGVAIALGAGETGDSGEQDEPRKKTQTDPLDPSLPSRDAVTQANADGSGDLCTKDQRAQCNRCNEVCLCTGDNCGCGSCGQNSNSGCSSSSGSSPSSGCGGSVPTNDKECCRSCAMTPVSTTQAAVGGSLAFGWISAPLWFLLWADRRRRRR